MSRSKRWTVALASALLATALSGCGDDAVSAREYLTSFCGAVADWGQEIQERGGELQNLLSSQSSPEDQKNSLVGFIDDIISETETMISEVEEAGAPDVEDGEEIAGSVIEGLEQVSSALKDARNEIEDLSTDDEEQFTQGVQAAFISMDESRRELEQPLDDLNTDELNSAKEDVDACQEIPEF